MDVLDELKREGREEGRREGREEGERKGRVEGRVEGAARALLTVFQGRGIEVPDVVRERILGEKDIERLEHWLRKAVVASTLGEVLDEPH